MSARDWAAQGGPAFPVPDAYGEPGMSVRDYAAMQFMAAAFTGAVNLGALSAAERKVAFGDLAELCLEAANSFVDKREA